MRVTNMAGVDLSVFRFDYDLTFAALLMNADGTIYHTYGGRDSSDATSHLSMPSFARVLRETLADHAVYQRSPAPPRVKKKVTIEDLKKKARNDGKPECFHCHMVYDYQRQHARLKKRLKKADAFLWPDPAQLGLGLDREAQTKITRVERGSAAASAGLRVGDELLELGGRRLRTLGDVQRVLQDAPAMPTALRARWARAGRELEATLRLAKNWKVPTPRVFAWRPSKWHLSPKPGFGGQELSPDELADAGLPRDGFAFRVNYIVNWGPDRHTGQNAARAGIRKGDVVFSVGGKSDFESVAHFHSWFRLTQKAGRRIPVQLIRGGKRLKLRLTVVD